MPTPPSDETKRLFELLADGEWHLYDDVRDKLAKIIPPGKALRRYEQNVEYKRRTRGEDSYDTSLSEDDRIYYGARMLSQAAITGWKGRAIIYTGDGRDTPKRIKLKPGFKPWGVDIDVPLIAPGSADSELYHELDNELGNDLDAEVEPEDEDLADELYGVKPPLAAAVLLAAGVQQESCDCITAVNGPQTPQDSLESFAARLGVAGPAKASEVSLDRGAEPVVEGPQRPLLADYSACSECGLLISDEVRHSEFHATHTVIESSGSSDFFGESELRHLVEVVVSEQLDAFQGGMQTYLAAHFQQLEGLIAVALGMPWRTAGKPKEPKYR